MTDTIVKLDRRKDLYLKDTEIKGRGLFCQGDIQKDDELETTPALILTEDETNYADETTLRDYVFTTGKLSKELRQKSNIKKMDGTSCVVMGIASFCNHDENPNAEVVWLEEDETLYYTLRATRDIPANTEICTSYGDEWFGNREIKEEKSDI